MQPEFSYRMKRFLPVRGFTRKPGGSSAAESVQRAAHAVNPLPQRHHRVATLRGARGFDPRDHGRRSGVEGFRVARSDPTILRGTRADDRRRLRPLWRARVCALSDDGNRVSARNRHLASARQSKPILASRDVRTSQKAMRPRFGHDEKVSRIEIAADRPGKAEKSREPTTH